MRNRTRLPTATLLAVACLVAGAAHAQSGGKVEGRVQDLAGEPIVGAQIHVVGTSFTAVTSARGYYFINNVPTGAVTLRAAFIGHRSVEVRDLAILAGQTVTQDFVLEPRVTELEDINVVEATNPLVPRDEVTTKQRVSGDFVEQLPVDRVEDLLAIQPGVVASFGMISIRGGRPEESVTYLDGVPVSPGYRLTGLISVNSSTIVIGTNALAEASITTGSSSAEFGNAQSGIISYQTRTGGARYTGNFSFESDEVAGISHSVGYNRVEAGFGGPVPGLRNLTFFTSAVLDGQRSQESGFGREKAPFFVPAGFDTTVAVPATADDPLSDTTYVAIQKLAVFTGRCEDFAGSVNPGIASNYGLDCQGIRVPQSPASSYQFLGKLNYTFGAGSKVALSALVSQSQQRFFQYNDIFNPSQNFAARYRNYIFTLNWTQTLVRSAEHALALDLYLSYQRDRGVEGPLASKGELATRNPFMGFMVGGLDFLFDHDNFPITEELLNNFRRNTGVRTPIDIDSSISDYVVIDQYRNSPYGLPGFTETGGPDNILALLREDRYIGRGNVDWQLDRWNRIKLGGEYVRHTLASYASALFGLGGADFFIAHPVDAAAWAEDRIDLGDVVVVGGLRYDYFNSDGSSPVWFDSTTDRFEHFPRVSSNPDFDPAHPERIFRPFRSHNYLSPHIQVSFPVTDRTNFRFSYAHQVQQPDFGIILRRSNNDWDLSRGVYGADLGFAKTIAFEFGVRHAFSEDMVLDISAYNNDNLANPTGRQVMLYDPLKRANVQVNMQTTEDFGNTRGIDIRLDRRFGRIFNGVLTYTYQNARNTGDDPFSYTQRSSIDVSSVTGQSNVPAQAILPTSRSRPHNLTGAFVFSFPADWKQGALGTILNRAGFSGVFRYASGTAYTRCPDSPGNLGITSDAGGCSYALALGEFNGARLPPVKEFNLKVTKGFSFRGLDLTVYGDFRNAFNFRNVTRVYSATNGIRNKKLEAIGWTVDSATFAQEAAASGVYDTLGNIDLRFGGAVASGCGNWVDQGGRPLVPNCVYLIRAEERWGNGDHIFDLDEQFRAHRVSQLLGLGEQNFTATPRRIRVGVEINF